MTRRALRVYVVSYAVCNGEFLTEVKGPEREPALILNLVRGLGVRKNIIPLFY